MIIGLNGSGRCGKDTGCRLLQEIATGRTVVRDAFADRLKRSAAAAVALDRDVLEKLKDTGRIVIEKPNKKGDGFEMVSMIGLRRYLERYGTEAHRDVFAQDFWIEAVMENHVDNLCDDPTTVTVITDLRFQNEALAVKAAAGVVWEIIRPGYSLESEHPSNQPLPRHLVDRTIRNDEGMAEYREKLAQAWKDTPSS